VCVSAWPGAGEETKGYKSELSRRLLFIIEEEATFVFVSSTSKRQKSSQLVTFPSSGVNVILPFRFAAKMKGLSLASLHFRSLNIKLYT
jgi:hypothetical protein